MYIRKVQIYCDDCRVVAVSTRDGSPAPVAAARDLARGEGWHTVDRKDFCPTCHDRNRRFSSRRRVRGGAW